MARNRISRLKCWPTCLPHRAPPPPDAATGLGRQATVGKATPGWRAGGPREGCARAGQAASSPRCHRARPHSSGDSSGCAEGRLAPRPALSSAPLRGGARAAGRLTWQTRSPACSPGAQGCCGGWGSQLGSRKQWLRTGPAGPQPQPPTQAAAPGPQHLCLRTQKRQRPPQETPTHRETFSCWSGR